MTGALPRRLHPLAASTNPDRAPTGMHFSGRVIKDEYYSHVNLSISISQHSQQAQAD